MKRFITALVAVLLVAGSLAFLQGCGGGDTGQAKEYMKAGDDMIVELQDDSEDIESKWMEIWNGLEDESIQTSSDFDEMAADYVDYSEGLIDKANDAKAEYEKILDLNGVDDYVEYAKLSIDLIDIRIDLLEEMNGMLEDTSEYLKKLEAGTLTEAEVNAFQKAIADVQADIENMIEDGEKLEDEMDKLKKEKGL